MKLEAHQSRTPDIPEKKEKKEKKVCMSRKRPCKSLAHSGCFFLFLKRRDEQMNDSDELDLRLPDVASDSQNLNLELNMNLVDSGMQT